MALRLDAHRTAERRSLAYHAEIAARIPDDPSLLESARARVRRWRNGDVAERYVTQWSALLDRDRDQILRALIEDSPTMTALRQVSPFVGALDPRTRWKIWRATR